MDNPFQAIDWGTIESINFDLCRKSGHQHGPTSDGSIEARAFFEQARDRPIIDMVEVTEILRKLHKIAPFLFLNGNTFSETGKTMLLIVTDSPSARLRSLVGHHIAGTEVLTTEELSRAFEEDALD